MKAKVGKKLRVTSGNTTIKRVFDILLIFILVVAVTYGFLALVNWTFDITEFTRFSRVILGIEGVIFLIRIIDEL